MPKGRVTRRGLAVAVPAVAVTLSLATVAWACTTKMMGDIYFTSYTTATGCSTTKVSSNIVGTTVCSSAFGLATNDPYVPANKYELRYAGTAADCHNSTNKIKNNDSIDGLFTATLPSGGWSNQKVTLSMSSGTYVVCAATPAAVDGPIGALDETGWWSQTHLTIS